MDFPERWPPVTVLIVTYNRMATIRKVIPRLEAYLHYPGQLLWMLADDGSPEGYVAALCEEFSRLKFSATVTPRGGLGANFNNGLRAAFEHTDYVFLTEDDWVAQSCINLTRGVWLLESAPEIGLVRYDDIVIGMRYEGAVLKHPYLERDVWVCYYVADKRSRYLYPGGHPNLVHRRYYDAYGFYKEGGEIASVERHFSKVLAEQDGPEIAIMSENVGPSLFKHIGKTWKGTEEGDPNYGKR